jgi:hypothetical protein
LVNWIFSYSAFGQARLDLIGPPHGRSPPLISVKSIGAALNANLTPVRGA